MAKTQEILVIGGGIIGLAIAVELQLRGARVTVLSRDFHQAATQAAGGMLAPQAERLPLSPMLELGVRSRALYSDWTGKLEQLSGLSTGYWPCGILAPSETAEPLPLPYSEAEGQEIGPAIWLDYDAIRQRQPGVGDSIQGGWWFPKDAQVDNRLLAKALLAAAIAIGVEVCEGVTVTQLERQGDRIQAALTTQGDRWQADRYILATGAWVQELLPISVVPRKGQMLSLRVPIQQGCDGATNDALPLRQVLFGHNLYLIPRQDGRIVIGATSEDVDFTPHNTPEGIATLLTGAMHLYPPLRSFPIEELWWGFRPATADTFPILGASPYENLVLATGHYRNGILLAPITANLVADWILNQAADPLLSHFRYDRAIASV